MKRNLTLHFKEISYIHILPIVRLDTAVPILPLMYKIIFVKPKRNKARIGNNANFILSMCIVIDQQNILNLSD